MSRAGLRSAYLQRFVHLYFSPLAVSESPLYRLTCASQEGVVDN